MLCRLVIYNLTTFNNIIQNWKTVLNVLCDLQNLSPFFHNLLFVRYKLKWYGQIFQFSTILNSWILLNIKFITWTLVKISSKFMTSSLLISDIEWILIAYVCLQRKYQGFCEDITELNKLYWISYLVCTNNHSCIHLFISVLIQKREEKTTFK